MPRISAVVLTYNEEEMIARCLRRLSWADEIVLVDSLSTDRTVELAKAAGARVLPRPFKNFADQVNWGFEQAENEWLMLVDADELVTPRLRDSVLETVKSDPGHDIYNLRRDSYVWGRLLRSSSWSNEWIPRLCRKGTLHFTGEVHPAPQLGGRSVGRLDGVLIHYPYRSTKKYFEKFQLYSTLWAEKALAGGRRSSVPKACAASMWRVFHDYVVRGGIRDGTVGFVLSLLAGMHTFTRHIKLWGIQNAAEFARVYEEDGDGA